MATPISQRMEALGFTDAALAVEAGCERSMVTKLKLGKATASLPLAIRLGKLLDIPPESFVASREAVSPGQGEAA